MSQPIPTFNGKVERGKLTLNNPEAFQRHMHTLDGNVVVVVRKPKKNRSDQQNKYYWGVLIEIARQYFGYTADEMHEAFKFKFLRHESKGLPTVKSTSTLGTLEMIEYLANCIQLCAEYGVVIPDPNQVDYETNI